MKKIFTLLFSCFVPFVCSADYVADTNGSLGSALQYKVTDAIKNSWGNPKLSSAYIQDASTDYGAFRIKQGWACCGDTLENSTKIKKQDDVAIMAFVAHNITEHGAEFCLEQFAAKSSSNGFSLYHQQPRWPGLQCAWFCEPGWDGEACMKKNDPDAACNTTNYKQRINEVKTKIYEGNDAISLHSARMGVAEYTAALDFGYVKGGKYYYPHEIIIGAVDFMEHGIVAKPILIAAVGNHPVVTNVTTSGVATGKTKVLCAQGFTADDSCNVSSRNCGQTLWCNGYSEDVYKSKSSELEKVVTGYCTSYVCTGDKALGDDLKTCVDCKSSARTGRCDVAGTEAFGKCKQCSVGFFFNPTTCECDVASAALSRLDMQYGKYRTDVVTNQCWTKENEKSYKECVMTAVE